MAAGFRRIVMATPMMARMKKEIEMLSRDPPPGVCAWLKSEDKIDHLEAGSCAGVNLCD